MSPSKRAVGRRLDRRAFLRGAAGVSVALPFLESLPDRSAWAAGEEPVFALLICAVGGVVGEHFFPAARGPLTTDGLAAAGKATSALAAHADKLLFVSGVNWPGSRSDIHQEGLCMSLTGRMARPGTEADNCREPLSACTTASGRSADWEICDRTDPGSEPLVIYWGNRGFTSERLSYSSPGQVARGIVSPYGLYQQLVGLATADGSTTPDGDRAARLLLESRKSVHDLVREELQALLRHPRLASADRMRLQEHFQAIRDVETGFGGMANEAGAACTMEGIDVDRLESLKDFTYSSTRTEEMMQLHLSLVSLAFACNYRRVATIQWGDAYDSTIYDVPSNARRWKFAYISHRAESDSITGQDELAAKAHAEIDAVRMKTLATGLDQFQARGLSDKSVVLWTNHLADGPTHSIQSVPHIIWGSPRGYLKQGAYVDAGGVKNNKLLNTVLSAVTGTPVENFGEGEGGQLDELLA
jgi:Protein of unknown function (DUF1552)